MSTPTLKLTPQDKLEVLAVLKQKGLDKKLGEMCQPYITTISLIIGKKDRHLGCTVGMMSVDQFLKEIQE